MYIYVTWLLIFSETFTKKLSTMQKRLDDVEEELFKAEHCNYFIFLSYIVHIWVIPRQVV